MLGYRSKTVLGSTHDFLGHNDLFLRFGWGLKTVLGSTHLVEQLSFCIFPSILIFDFDIIFGNFLTFWRAILRVV